MRDLLYKFLKPIFIVLIVVIFSSILVGISYAQSDAEAKKPVLPYNYKFLAKQVRWGCLVCHSDHNLSKINKRTGMEKSLFIDQNIIGNSVHKRIACLDCHENFSYNGHPREVPQNYRRVAGLACKKCHPYQYQKYSQSIHGELVLTGSRKKAAMCADCHGSHDIKRVTTKEGNAAFRTKSRWVCAKCHADRAISLNDYYHGAAYRRGEPDAPACWDCHDNHGIKKANNSSSTVNEVNLPGTCAKCHTDTSGSFTNYAKMMHGRNKILANNFIAKIFYGIFPEKKQTLAEVTGPTAGTQVPKVQESGTFLSGIIKFFFPKSLRPRKESE